MVSLPPFATAGLEDCWAWTAVASSPVSLPGLETTEAREAATLRASWPRTRLGGMTPPYFGSRGISICWRTSPRTALWPKPSWTARWRAASRFGPTVPLVPARASSWHEPHFLTNSCLPATRLSLLSLVVQPASATRAAAPALSRATRGAELMRRGTLSSGHRKLFEAALRGSEDPAGDALPRPAFARGGDERLAGLRADVLRRVQPSHDPVGELMHRARAEGKREQVAGVGRHRRRQRRRDLREPGMTGADGERTT